MKVICNKRCVIGEGPIWNKKENLLYFVNAVEKEICVLDINSGALVVRHVGVACYAICFDVENRLIVSCENGVFRLNDDNSLSSIYDTKKYSIINANDMKVGPDGRIYVGTISNFKKGYGEQVDGKLYSIDKNGTVKILLDDLYVSNGLEWSIDGKRFYHTDSNTGFIKEYDFNVALGEIKPTGRKVFIPGVDGFTIDALDRLVVTRWDDKDVCFINTKDLEIEERISVPFANPTSCCFAGKDMKMLVVVTANYNIDVQKQVNAGFTFLEQRKIGGKLPSLFLG